NDPIGVSAATLTSPTVVIGSADAQISFKNKFITESGFDGMVLEYSTNGGGVWTDVITGGGSFVTGGYNGAISTGFMSPIGGRQAWSGTSAGGFIDTVINLPAALNGQTVIFRWLMASDTTVAATGVWIDDIQVFGARVCNACTVVSQVRADFDGDGKTDVSVFRGGTTWYINRSTAGFKADNFGLAGDVAVPGDYDGDGKTDEAVRRGGTTWYIRGSTVGDFGLDFGSQGDIPVAGDYDGDGKTDIAVYRPSSGTWFIRRSSTGVVAGTQWGNPGDIPVVGDFDGDRKSDLTVFRPAAPNFTCLWHTLTSQGVYKVGGWGISTDKLVPADYDGDGKIDYAVFRNGIWYILGSSNSVQHTIQWGSAGDKLVPGDYNGDGKYDVAVFRNGTWYILEGGTGLLPPNPRTEFFGQGGDFGVPAAYVPEQ
ncbi:MAG: FG-GAP-like repeat-containing protein, partial [Pyrinomonadaceae bacterium]